VLRRAGKSYAEIANELGVAKSTLSTWFSGVDFSKAIRSELTKQATKKGAVHLRELHKVRGAALAVRYDLAEKEALKEMELYRRIPLFTTAIAMYWSEGDTYGRNQVRLTSTDPAMLKIFVTFLGTICGIPKDKIHLALFIYPDLSEVKCKRFWAKELGASSFYKTQVLAARKNTKKVSYGLCSVVVSDTYLKRKIMLWIDRLPEMVLNTVPQLPKGGKK